MILGFQTNVYIFWSKGCITKSKKTIGEILISSTKCNVKYIHVGPRNKDFMTMQTHPNYQLCHFTMDFLG